MTVKSEYAYLFPKLPSLSRFYRIQRNFERIYADLALLVAQHVEAYAIDSKPLPICQGSRYQRDRAMSEATSGYGGVDSNKMFYGFKLHAVASPLGYIYRFAIVPANVHDATVGQCMLDELYDDLNAIVGDKAYVGCGIYTPPKKNAKTPSFGVSLLPRHASV